MVNKIVAAMLALCLGQVAVAQVPTPKHESRLHHLFGSHHDTDNLQQRFDALKLRRAAAWLVLGGATIFGGAFIVLGVSTMWSNQGWLVDIAKAHFPATVGLPAAALVAMAVVLFLEFNAGPIEFEVVGFKFRGASGPVVLWTFCFLAIAGAIKLLW